ncbi:hypothetical protein JQ572_26215 [Bradyrhizobium japonicum]|nr:hypothetical protein [Bradyrhizobium japonicum]MBR0974105.1 hypothetical protein [Bradyrhizobium japonicum]
MQFFRMRRHISFAHGASLVRTRTGWKANAILLSGLRSQQTFREGQEVDLANKLADVRLLAAALHLKVN